MRPIAVRSLRRLLIATVLACLLLCALASIGLGAEVTRDAYKEAVEPICKLNAKANERLLGNVRAEVKADKLKPAAAKFAKAAAALKATIAELRAVPPPTADESRLSKWLGYVTAEADLFESAAAKLRAGNKGAASAKVIKLTHNANQANNVVIPFEFHYCRFEPNKYT